MFIYIVMYAYIYMPKISNFLKSTIQKRNDKKIPMSFYFS
jgi:hypothetical protein